MKQESQLATYAAGPVKSTVDYIIVRDRQMSNRQTDRQIDDRCGD